MKPTQTRSDYVIGAFVAEGVVSKILKGIKPGNVLMVPTPHGTSYFRAGEWTPGQIVARLCERYETDGLTVANWLKRYCE